MRCIHCLKEIETTRDHVFPNSWYPDNTSQRIQRPVAPACISCNNTLGYLEESLFRKLALCTNPKKAEVSGIHKKLYRSFGVGVDSKQLKKEELIKRKSLVKKILESVSPYEEGIGYFPGLGPDPDFPPENHKSIPFPEKELLAVSKKIIKGLEYCFDKRYIEKPFELDLYFPKENSDLSPVERILSIRSPITYGPGFKVERSTTTEIPKSVIYRITIWGKLKIYGTVMKPEDKRQL